MQKTISLLFIGSLSASSMSLASSDAPTANLHDQHAEKNHAHEHSNHHKAHTHGTATLTLALESGTLDISFESPAVNIVGFEHRASHDDEKQRVNTALSQLKKPNQLFTFYDSHCTANHFSVNAVDLLPEPLHKTEQADNRSDVHEHGDHHHHDNAHSRNDDQAMTKEQHAEVTAHYQFSCPDSAALTSLTAHFQSHFPAIEKLNVLWITDEYQGATTLTSSQEPIQLKKH